MEIFGASPMPEVVLQVGFEPRDECLCATSYCFSSQEHTAEADWKSHGLYIGPAVLFSLLFTSAFAKDETFSVRGSRLMLESRMNLIGSCRSMVSMKTLLPSFPTITHEENRFIQHVLPHLSQGSFLYIRNMSSGLTMLSTLSNFEGMTRRMIYIPIDRACSQNLSLGAANFTTIYYKWTYIVLIFLWPPPII